MTTAYITHPRYAEHRLPGYNHPENPRRIESIWEQFALSGLDQRLLPIAPIMPTRAALRAVHSEAMIQQLEHIAINNRLTFIDQDTYALPASWDIAQLSAGGVIRAIEAVMCGEADNALTVTRPPGHHATPTRAMGFCLLSNIAIGAQYALDHLDAKRILIVDYDVHHGNGTQDVFYGTDQVLFLSTHQYPFYPSTGALHETGSGAGAGYTVNVPLPSNTGDAAFAQVYSRILTPIARRYQPDLILVSAGFDAHWADPLGQMRLTLRGYAQLTRMLIALAQELCGGKIVFVTEGGYDLTALAHGVRNIGHALLGEDIISDPQGTAGGKDADVGALLQAVETVHRL